MRRKRQGLPRPILLLATLGLSTSCGGSATTAIDVPNPDGRILDDSSLDSTGADLPPADTGGEPGGATYQPPAAGTLFTYLLSSCDTPPVHREVPARIDHTQTVNGVLWHRLEVGDFEAATRDGFVSLSRVQGGRIEFLGAEVYRAGSPDPEVTFRLDTPVGGPLQGEQGATDTTSATGQICIGTSCSALDLQLTYTLVEAFASVDVPYGTVADCQHIRLEQRSSDMPGYVLTTDWWVKTGIGMVKATEVPGWCALELKSVTPH